MSSNAVPSINPSNNHDLAGMLTHTLGKTIQNIHCKLPAKIISYDRTANRASVQLMIMLLTTDNSTFSRAPIAEVPVFQYGSGEFFISFNLKAGNLGWIDASDRDISLFLQTYSEEAPNTIRNHDFADGVFYPDIMTKYTIQSEDAENMVIQNLDGSTKITLGASNIKIKHPTLVTIDAPSVVCTGTISATDVIYNGISAINHVHVGVTSGASNTGVSH